MLDLIHRLWGALTDVAKSIFSTSSFLRLLLSGLGVLVIAYLFDFITFPFWPFTTQGKIYVDSPEVYTRERLVNDRYDQDYWLRMRLQELDEPGKLQLMAGEYRTFSKAQVGAAPIPREDSGPDVSDEDTVDSEQKESGRQEGIAPAADQATTSNSDGFRLPFDQEFRVAAGIRDMIRQQVLENMLDDRHDLTGNSVYGLKFDTTVIPGRNTRQRAIVRVSLEVEDLFKKSDEKQLLLNHFFPDKVDENYKNYKKQREYYFNWLKDLEKRLNSAEKSVYGSLVRTFSCPEQNNEKDANKFMHFLTRNTLNAVLGIPTEVFSKLHPTKGPKQDTKDENTAGNAGAKVSSVSSNIKLPDPWARFFTISTENYKYPEQDDRAKSCPFRISFNVYSLDETFRLSSNILGEESRLPPNYPEEILRLQCNGLEVETRVPLIEPRCKDIPIGSLADTGYTVYVTEDDYKLRTSQFEEENPGLKYPLKSDFFTLEKVKGSLPECNKKPRALCTRQDWIEVSMPSGLFNFIDKMSSRDAYAYAIFPKNDIVSLFVEAESQLDSPFVGFAKRLRESTTASVLVGFGEGPKEGPNNVPQSARVAADDPMVFGWVISARGSMQPTQKNQLALVSVPAWANKIDLEIEKGWVDRQGQPRFDGENYKLDIAIPPSLEVFDFIFRDDARVTLGPTIRQSEMDQDIYLRAGRRAQVLIPGSRLWRSATVTLGAQTAERIRVLPNMEGIIAEFNCLALPSAAYRESKYSAGNETQKTSKDKNGASSGNEKTSEDQNGASPVKKNLCPLPEFYKDKGNNVSERFSARPVTLRVWTSEGVTTSNPHVCVIYDREDVATSARDYCKQ